MTNVQQARVSLDVTPTVTNDGAVQLKLNLSKDLIFNFSGTQGGIGNRTMSTLVLVDSGSTLVIGGIYSLSSTESSSGFPFLRKLPLFGFLFGNESSDMQRSELFFFVTPKSL
jgi:type IV pilus assembly protein PilQ